MKKLLTLTAVGTVLVCSDALASGFNLKEQSAAAQGNAFAGATAGAEDISYSFFNPAGLTRHKGTKISVGGTWIAPRSRAKRAHADTVIPGDDFPGFQDSGYTGDIVHSAVAPAIYMSKQLDDRFTLGLSLNVPYGMITKYNDLWAGRFHGTLSKVTTVTLTPMIAYKATDELSLGAGFQMQYIKATLRNGVRVPNPYTGGVLPGVEDKARLEGDTFDIGYQLGALYELTPQTRFGIGYRSQIKHKLKGDIEFDGLMRDLASQDISARLTTPANLTIGAYHDINDKWAVMAEFGRTYWSSFEELRIKGDKGLDNVTQEKWKDTTFYSIGASYKVDDQWKLRAGFAVDQSAVGQEYRTPRIPDADRLWYSAGVEYKYDDKWTFNVGYTYIRADKGKVKLNGFHDGDTARGSLRADYENDIHILAASMNYNF